MRRIMAAAAILCGLILGACGGGTSVSGSSGGPTSPTSPHTTQTTSAYSAALRHCGALFLHTHTFYHAVRLADRSYTCEPSGSSSSGY
jgi:hypothetical protein